MNPNLPIYDFRNEIVDTINNNPVVVITAETGAGKTTQVPQYLLEEGYRILITQPRRIATRTVSERVAYETGTVLGDIIGYRTAIERKDSDKTQCLFATDGLALIRDLMGNNTHDILIIDEVHEWNINIETLIAWSRHQIRSGSLFKVVLMSATIEDELLAQFFDNAPIIRVPGRTFPVYERNHGKAIEKDVIDLVAEGRNVLVFQPGKKEIYDTIEKLEFLLGNVKLDAVLLPLHADLTLEEQSECFKQYQIPKVIVSTNIAQTSITVSDIDAIVDSGKERRIELSEGIEGLYVRPIAIASREQRKGRAGRTKPGIYIDHCDDKNRPQFPIAEILRSLLDQTVLRLAQIGFDMEDLDFFHQPKKAHIKEAKKALKAIGCMTKNGHITEIGSLVAMMPISARFGRMIIEADSRGVVDDIVSIAALMEVGDITDRFERRKWTRFTRGESQSDAIAQLNVFKHAKLLSEEELADNGIHKKNFLKAVETRDHLADSVRHKVSSFSSTGNRKDIILSLATGMTDRIYCNYDTKFVNLDEISDYDHDAYEESYGRSLSRDSVVSEDARWIIGLPFDLHVENNYGSSILNLVCNVTVLSKELLAEITSHLTEKKTRIEEKFSVKDDACISLTEIWLKKAKLSSEWIIDRDNPRASLKLAQWFARSNVDEVSDRAIKSVIKDNQNIQKQASELNIRTCSSSFKVFSFNELVQFFNKRLDGAKSISEIKQIETLKLPELDTELVQKIKIDYPDFIDVAGIPKKIAYTNSCPTIEFEHKELSKNKWKSLPDILCLPNGRSIEMSSVIDNKKISSKTIEDFKKKFVTYINEKQWSNWKRPDFIANTERVSDIQSVQYGKHVETQEPLVAYGMCIPKKKGNNTAIQMIWYKTMHEAEKSRNKIYPAGSEIYVVNKSTETEWLSQKKMNQKFIGTDFHKLFVSNKLKSAECPSTNKAFAEGFARRFFKEGTLVILWNVEKISELISKIKGDAHES